MKTRIAMLAIAALAAGLANAQDGERPPGPPRGERQLPPEILEKFDKDKDGKLNEEERKEAMEARRAEAEKRRKEMLEKYDSDKNGELSEEERGKMMADFRAKREEILKKYDKDEDGRLSEEERKAAIEAGEEMPPMRMGGPGGPGAGRGPRGGAEGGPGPRGQRGPRGGEAPPAPPEE